MGLDMYAYFVDKEDVIDDFNIKALPRRCHRDEDWYWRKNRYLHNWVADLYHKKTGKSPEKFNCVSFRLYKEDLEVLKKAIKKRILPSRQGFFFGNNDYTKENAERDLDFVKHAEKAIDDGLAVYYDSSW